MSVLPCWRLISPFLSRCRPSSRVLIAFPALPTIAVHSVPFRHGARGFGASLARLKTTLRRSRTSDEAVDRSRTRLHFRRGHAGDREPGSLPNERPNHPVRIAGHSATGQVSFRYHGLR